jgi:fibronectin type 3 domain-containing protein
MNKQEFKMKALYYKIILFALFTGYIAIPAASQQRKLNDPVAVGTTKGIWIYLGNYVPKDGYYLIERKRAENGSYESLGRVQQPVTKQEMEKRQQNNNYFDKLDPLNGAELEKIWRYIQLHGSNDSLVSSNLPVMHLLIGTAYFDDKAITGQSYIYKVSYFRDNNSPAQVRETKSVTWPASPSLPVADFVDKKYGTGQLSLQWYIKEKKELAYFNVYRSVYGKNEFRKISLHKGFAVRRDSLLLIAVDSIGTSPSLYEYKVEPLDIYGNSGQLSGICEGGSIEDHYVPPVTGLSAVSQSSNHMIKLRWKLENRKYINGITVMRSASYDTGYSRIANLLPSDTTYSDYVPIAGENYYYYLVVNSAENNQNRSAKVAALYKGRDQKPVEPSQIAVETIKDGVKLFWAYDEPFAKGFYVYRQSTSKEPFRQVSPFIPAGMDIYFYADTSNALRGNNVYSYYVRAVTDNELFSDPSDTVFGRPGRSIIITAPMHIQPVVDENRVSLVWDNMTAIQPGLLGYKVYRKSQGKNYLPLYDDSSKFISTNFITDSICVPGIKYEYAVSTMDLFGNESALSLPVAVTIPSGLPAAPTGLKAEVDEGGILVRWGQMGTTDIEHVTIYRTERGKSRLKIATFTKDQNGFLDKEISKGKLYFYELTVSNSRQQESGFSEKTAIRFK